MTRARWGAALSTLGYVALALACLWQWGTPLPWSRMDGFSGGFLGVMLLAVACDAGFGLGQAAFRSKEAFREASGMTYDAGTIIVLGVLSIGDTLVFLDYGHWHLARALEHRIVQAFGLALEALAAAWLLWTDTYLAAHFARPLSGRALIQNGPFRHVRHPRYVGVLGMRIAFALTYASVIGWTLSLAWLLVLLRRIHLEERHLRTVFGKEYELYAGRTPRLIPRALTSVRVPTRRTGSP